MAHRIKRSSVPDAVTNFEALAGVGYVRLPVVAALLSVSPATVWRMVKRGTLPAPRKLSERVTGWNVGELRQVLDK